MQGTRKPPTSEVVEAAKSDGRDRTSAPPIARESVAPRRDDRAEPDDDRPGSSISRVDVVNVDTGVRDVATSGMMALRRELAKLHQQAAAVEKSLEDQRRDRTESADRLERMTERANQLEAKLAAAEGELSSLRRQQEATMHELLSTRGERDDLARAVDAAKAATAELAALREEAEKRKRETDEKTAELAAMRTKLDRTAADAEQCRTDAVKARKDAEAFKSELVQTREAAAKAREDVTRAQEETKHANTAARDKIDLLERALDDARGAVSRTEAQLEELRTDREVLTQHLELARANLAEATAARTTLEQRMRDVREDIANAFSRLGMPLAGAPAATAELAPAVAPAATSAPEPEPGVKEPISIPPEAVESVPPSDPPQRARSAPPPVPRVATASSPSIDSEWPAAPTSAQPAATSSEASEAIEPEPSPASQSVLPPSAAIPSPTYASVPPQIHTSEPTTFSRRPTPPGTKAPSVPVPLLIETPAVHEGFAPFGALRDSTTAERDELLAKLCDPASAASASAALREHPSWLVGPPPAALTTAIATVDFDAEGPVFELARAWEREPLCAALVSALRAEKDSRAREHCGWVLKHLAAPSAWKEIAELALSEEEGPQARRWLLEALDRLAAGRGIGWAELGDLVTTLAKHSDPALRDGVVGILFSLDRSDEKRRVLLEILREDDDEGVIASAVNALASVLPIELDPTVVERLLAHPSVRVQRSLRDLIERARREAKV